MPSRAHRPALLCLLVMAIAVASLAQNNPPEQKRGYKRPTISQGSPARPLTRPAGGRPADLSKDYIREHGNEVDLTAEDVADVVVTSETKSRHTGITHVYLRQRVDGLEVFGADSNFNVGADGALLSFGTSFLPEVRQAINRTSPEIGAVDAASAAAAHVGLNPGEPLAVVEEKGGVEQETILTGGGIASTPIVAKLVYQPVDPADVRLAWQVDIDEASGQHLWRMTVDAETGEVLNQEDYVVHDNWDLPAGEAAAADSAAAQDLGTIVALSSPTPVFDGSSYRVFAIPKESPNDGPQTLVENPADATASPFGWHDTDQAPGAEFTLTRGNNAHAYLDQDTNNGADAGFDVDGGAGLAFDFTADLAEHAQNYRDAVVTNLFYWNNLFHDVLYRYGFDEASGNFQANNYGRGGLGGDYVRAEAADGGGTNNANFSIPVENATSSGTPRMQMFLWPGDQFGLANQVVVDGVGTFDAAWARFSPAPTVAGTAGAIVNAGNGCAAADYLGAPATDWIAIVTGNNTGCQNIDKARRAAEAGAKALIVANTSSARPVLTGSLTTPGPAIPVASINLADGNTIRTAIAAGTAGSVTGTVRKHPDHPGIRDGDFENGIVVHEYGHGVSIRLTGGPAVNCLTGDEQGGEGWSDYFAMIMTLNPEIDSGNGQRGMGPYALFQPNRQGAGIRPRPYSRTMEIQPFTYDSIKNGAWLNGATLAAPHGIGHGWAAVLWDVTWDLIGKHGFNPDLYGPWNSSGNNRAFQYVMDGLKLQGCAPGFVAARNAIIAAAEALDPGDSCTLWASFARRGLGFSAVQGTTSRGDNTEAFDTHPACRASFVDNVSASPAINVVNIGSTVPLTFSYPGAQGGLDVFAENSPYSRQVECSTLRTVDPNATFTTPRPFPVAMLSPGGSGVTFDKKKGLYTFNWQTDAAWAGTCREAVLTRKDGVQHRSYFFFDSQPSHKVSGFVRDSAGQAVPNATVRIVGSSYGAVLTNAEGFYSFPAVAVGTYTATATPAGSGCVLPQTLEFSVSRPTRVDFTLPTRVDAFGYSCRNEAAAFEEAALVEPITGTSGVGTVNLPFPFVFYGQSYDRVYVCANGFVEFAGPATTNCSSANGTIPGTGRPNGAIYPFWDDLVVDAASSIRTELKGSAPGRRFVIEFRNVHVSGNTSQRLDFNAVLLENGQVLTQLRNIADDIRERGSSATIGIEMHTGTVALMYSLNTAVLAVEPAVTTIRYTPPQLYTVSGQVSDTDGTPEPGASVTLQTPAFTLTATTDAGGLYSFPGVPAGTYSAIAAAGRCKGDTETLVVSANATLDFTLGDLPDAFGYRCGQESAAFEEAGTVQPITGTSGVGAVAIPFPFTFYGETYNSVYVCANGFVELAGPATTNCSSANGTIPGTGRPNGAIYPFWDDLVVDSLASIRTELKGSEPNRRFVIEFRNVHITGQTSQRLDFNTVLFEDGQILTQYKNISAAVDRERGNSATLGIEMHTGTVALMYSLNAAILPVEPAVTTIRYVPPALFAVSGLVRDASGNPAPGVIVTLERAPLILTATTDAAGFYSFGHAPAGEYAATAKAGGCSGQFQSVTITADTTLDFTLGDISDEFGYRCRLENHAFEEADTIIPISGDDLQPFAGGVELPFPFTFYGQTYTDAFVCTNGYMEFAGPTTSSCVFTNTALPNANRPNGTIYALWDDVVVDASASIRADVKGTAPNRTFVVEYRNVRFISGTQRLDFNIVLHEDGRVMTQYRNLADDGRERGNSSTIGIEDHTGTVALEFSMNEAILSVEPAITSIVYRPPGMP
jgi:extracellular elastinolytic metalloproteinase